MGHLIRTGLIIGSLLLGLAACGSESTSVGDEDLKGQPTQKELQDLFRAVDDNCAGNDNGNLTRFDPAKFSAADALAKLKKADRDARGVSCNKDRKYSESRES